MMIYVVASIEIDPDHREKFLAEFRAIVPDVLAEEGCIEYGPTIDVDSNIAAQGGARDNIVTIMEKWDSIQALEAHLVAPHMLKYRERVKSIVKGSRLQILQPV